MFTARISAGKASRNVARRELNSDASISIDRFVVGKRDARKDTREKMRHHKRMRVNGENDLQQQEKIVRLRRIESKCHATKARPEQREGRRECGMVGMVAVLMVSHSSVGRSVGRCEGMPPLIYRTGCLVERIERDRKSTRKSASIFFAQKVYAWHLWQTFSTVNGSSIRAKAAPKESMP